MSGIYIKGMEMPEPGKVIHVFIDSDGRCYRTLYKAAMEVDSFAEAFPVLDHGRLIDADELRASIKESIDECHKWANEVDGGEMYARVSQSLGTFIECSLRVKAAPTVIPADPAEEGKT